MATTNASGKSKASMLPRILKSLEAQGKFENNDPVIVVIGWENDNFKNNVARTSTKSCVWDIVHVKHVEDSKEYELPLFENHKRFFLVDCPGMTAKATSNKNAMAQLGDTLDACLAAGAVICGVLVVQDMDEKPLEWNVFENIVSLLGKKNTDLISLVALDCKDIGEFYSKISAPHKAIHGFPLESFTELLDNGASIIEHEGSSASDASEVLAAAFARGITRGAPSLAQLRQDSPDHDEASTGRDKDQVTDNTPKQHEEKVGSTSDAKVQSKDLENTVAELESTVSALRFKLRENERRVSLERQAERRAHESAMQELQAELDTTKKLLAASQSTEKYLMQKLGNVHLDSPEAE